MDTLNSVSYKEILDSANMMVRLRAEAVPGFQAIVEAHGKELGNLLVAEHVAEKDQTPFTFVAAANGTPLSGLLRQMNEYRLRYVVYQRTEGEFCRNGRVSVQVATRQGFAAHFDQYGITVAGNLTTLGKSQPFTVTSRREFRRGFSQGRPVIVAPDSLPAVFEQEGCDRLKTAFPEALQKLFELLQEHPHVEVGRDTTSAVSTFVLKKTPMALVLHRPRDRDRQEHAALIKLKMHPTHIEVREVMLFGTSAEAAPRLKVSPEGKACIKRNAQAITECVKRMREVAKRRREEAAEK